VVAGAQDRAIRADVGAGRVFALAAHHRRTEIHAFNDVQARGERGGVQQRDILRIAVRHDAGNFTGTAADAFFRVGDNEPVHVYSPNPRRPWHRRCVGCVHPTESLTHVSSSGLLRLPPSCNASALGDFCVLKLKWLKVFIYCYT